MIKKTSPVALYLHQVNFLQIGMVVIMLFSGVGLFYSVSWIYEQVQIALGLEIAEVVVVFLTILVLFLILIGFGTGFSLDRILRRRPGAPRIINLLKWDGIYLRLLSYLYPHCEDDQAQKKIQPESLELQELLDRPRRRGRPPLYGMPRWRQVVLAWENRDPWHNPMTLAEFLSEEFGTHADGSPKVSENTYYDWHKRVLDEAQRARQTSQNKLITWETKTQSTDT